MNHINYNHLINRRQYLIVPEEIKIDGAFRRLKIRDNMLLYYHIDLSVKQSEDEKIILIGDAIDLDFPEYGNEEIIRKVAESTSEKTEEYISYLSGRFIFIIKDKQDIRIYHDAFATRKVFYAFLPRGTWIGSQPHLIAKYALLHPTKNKEIAHYYNSDLFKFKDASGIGEQTYYDEIKQLLPNHYLGLSAQKPIRYWPKNGLESKKIKEVVSKCSGLLVNTFISLLKRYNIMLPVTAGVDSRTLLAASTAYKNKIFYYINNTGRNIHHPDFQVPLKLSEKIGFKFNILNIEKGSSETDKNYTKIYYNNNPFASEKYVDVIYNYLLNYEKYVNVTGNFAGTAKAHYELPENKLNGYTLAEKSDIENYKFAVNSYQQWLNKTVSLSIEKNIHILDLFYWEERAANWGFQIQIDKDIAQEDFCPYNSRRIMELLLSVDRNKRKKPLYILQKKLVSYMCKEAVKPLFNPTLKIRFYRILYLTGIFKITQNFFRYIRNKI